MDFGKNFLQQSILVTERLSAGASENLIVSSFLERYFYLLGNIKIFFNNSETCRENHFNCISFHIGDMKNFCIESGGFRCVELLAEYEKNSAIGDIAGCRELEKPILEELNTFKEFWISMLS